MKPLVIFGAGGHAREVHQLVEDINAAINADTNAIAPTWQMLGFLVDAAFATDQSIHGLPILGSLEWLAEHPEVAVVVAVGQPLARQDIVARIQSGRHSTFATLVHPRAWIASRVRIGEGTTVFAGSLINSDADLGRHVSVNLGVSISHDCHVGDFVSLGPGVHLAGAVKIGRSCDIGTGASCRPGTSIGEHCVIGAGAAVVDDIPTGFTATGVPARTQC